MSLRGHLPPGSVGERLSLQNQMASSDIDSHIQVMSDPTKHEEEKLRVVQEIWDKTEVYIANAIYFHGMEKFTKTVLNYLQESSPQFIAENTVQKLRQKCLELILRMACHESTKSLVKDISKVTLRLIQIDNEKNAVLGLKILNDVWKQNKIYFIPEISTAVSFLKSIVKEMSVHLNNGMFEPQEFQTFRGPMPPTLDDNLVESYLNHCYHIQFIAVAGSRGEKVDFTLIPRSSVSLKVVQELSTFFVYVYQHHKQTMTADVIEFLHISMEFIALQLPANYKDFTGMVKEIMDDFHTAQAKILGFLMMMGKLQEFMTVILKHGMNLLKAILTLMETLDDKNVVIRKDILMSLKFCFATELKNNVVGFLPRLLDEDCIIGRGYTTRDNLRVFLYQILADLLHHIRFQLSFPLMLQASAVFCREMADPSLTFQTQVMCVRLLCSVCEALPKMEQLGEASRDMLWQTLDHLQYKMERIATYHLPLLIKTHGLEDSNGKRITQHELLSQEQQRPSSSGDRSRKASQDQGLRTSTDGSTPEEEVKAIPKDIPLPEVTKKSTRFTKPDQMLTDLCAVASPSMTVTEARNFVKYLLMTVKICCQNISTSARSNLSYPMEKERDIMENILKYGLICMDVFMLPNSTKNQPVPPGQRGKEEKEALDVFAHVFVTMDSDIYKEIFAKHICTIIERINSNSTVQLFANAFLVRSDFVCRFGGIMIRYLMDNMDKLAVSNDRTTLYVKLFKIIFSAIGCGQQITTEGEMMLKPYLPDLIRKATEFALTAKEPLNYFLLLRALFRSIGGGAHDILYGQFLPLLPNLLQFLNKLQSCNHRITMRELFLELCLTVPVRLSSLLPYLPLLMDPLVCALNGSTSLVQQGLRTLELCVDNLQPEYLFEHMAPVRSALIQGLWRVLSTSGDPASAQTAFRILGKFGGANRRILSCPQTLTYVNDNETAQACICVEFPRNSPELPPLKLDFSLSEIMQTAVEQMGNVCYRLSRMLMANPESTGNVSTLLPQSLSQPQPAQYQILKESCMALARCILSAALCPDPNISSDDWKQNVVDNLKDALKRLDTTTPNYVLFRGVRQQERKMYINALVVIMVGVIQKDMRPQYLNFYMGIVRQLTINALLESISPPELLNNLYNPTLCLDGSILVDALIEVLGDTNKEFLNSAVFCLSQFCDTCDVCIPDKTRWIQFPIIRHLVESVCNLCNGPAWFARLGGANGLLYIIKSYPVELLRHFVIPIVESLCEVIVGLSDEISSGAIDMSVSALMTFHKRVFTDYDMLEDRMLYLSYVVRIYLPLVFHNIEYVREKAWELLNSLKESGAPPMAQLLGNHRDIIAMNKDRIIVSLRCMSMTEQEASLAALNNLLEIIPEHIGMNFEDGSLKSFFDSVFDLCENDVHTLLSRDYYKSIDTCPGHFLPPYPMATQMENLKAVAIQSLIASYKVLCQDQPGDEEKKEFFSKKVLTIAVQSALFGPERIQTSATKALNKCAPIPMEALKEVAGNIISSFDESDGSFDVEKITQMEKLIGFNSELWNKELASKFVEQIKSWQTSSASEGFPARSVEDIKAIQSVMRLIMEGDVLDLEMVLKLVNFLAFFDLNYTTDTDFGFIGSICALVNKYPQEIVRHFCARPFLSNYVPFFCRILEHDRGQHIRDVLKNDNTFVEKLLQLYTLEGEDWKKNTSTDLEACIGFEESIVRIVDTLATKEADWFESNHRLLELMRKIWSGTEFKVRYNVQPIYREENGLQMVRVSLFPASKINVPHMYGKNFIRYLKKNPDNIEMLFDLMHAFDGTFGADFAFMRDFLENDLIPMRSIPWRVKALEYVLQKLEKEPEKYLKAPITSKMFQYVILPCLQFVFERYHSDDILGPGLPPDEDSTPDPNHCMTRLTNIIEKNRHIGFSEPNVIAMYQLCTLLVEYAPTHIHNNECKKQGTRLRTFMVFVWNTLTTGSSTSPTTHSIDPTVRFTGYLFLAHLIDKFTINRKIVLQVFNTLIAQYQMDNRDLIRKAIDVVTPAVPIRLMDDGYQQLLIHIKKVLAEESHNMPQVQHIVQAVCRNYRVYYHVRHELIQPMLSSVTRVLHCTSGAVEGLTGRRLSLDVCEMAIKWELLKKREEEAEGLEVESYLETLKNGDKDDQADDIKKEPKQTVIQKDHIDQIVTILLKFACTLQYQGSNPNAPSAYLSTTNELARRAQGLLRASLKPYVWGEVADVRYQWIEKQLTIPAEYANSRPESQHIFAQHIQQAQTTLEVLLALASSMNRPLLLSVLKPLQRSLISCMIGNYSGAQGHALVKTMNYLLGKLLEKSKGIANPLEELESLNQYIGKYINDAMANYIKATSGMVQSIFTPFSVLRSIMAHQPNYLDITCMNMFLRVLEKVVREQVSIHPGQDNRDKTTIDFLLVALELIRTRCSFMSAEQRRMFIQGILIPLIEKTHYEKVFESLFKVTLEILTKHTDRSMSNPGLSLAVRLHAQMERRILRMAKDPHSYPLMTPYLNLIHTIFDDPVYQTTDHAPRMYGAFYWGLTSPDNATRQKFLIVWERNQEPFLLSRFMFCLKEEGWQNFRKYYWIRHVVWLLTQACLQKPYANMTGKRIIYFRDCTTLAKTLEIIAGRDGVPSLGAMSMDPGNFNSPSENGQEPMDTSEPTEKTVLDKLVDGQRHFLQDAMVHDTSQMLSHVYIMMYNMSDSKFTPKIFKRLFTSLWYELLPNEKQEVDAAIVPFLTSGVHNSHVQSPHSVLTTWLEAVDSTRGEIKLPPKLVHFISKTHNAWHKGLLHLEVTARYHELRYTAFSSDQIRDLMTTAYGESEGVPYRETLDYLALLYKDMEELDPYTAIWNRRAIKKETVGVMNRIQRGEMKEAQKVAEEVIIGMGERMSTPESGQGFTMPLDQELNHLFEQYTICCEELLDWERVRDYANHNTVESPYLLMKAATHLPDWPMVRDCLDQLVGCVPQKYVSDYHLYHLMALVMPRKDQNEHLNPLQSNPTQLLKQKIEKFVDDTVNHHIILWRGLPSIVSHSHYKVLQAASLIREVADCVDLRIAIEGSNPHDFNVEVINQMKHIIKVWRTKCRNRLCCSADELSYYSLVYDWRIQIHQMTLRRLEEWDHNQLLLPHGANSQTILPVHSAAQGQMAMARAAKSMRNYELAIEQMNKLHTISAVPAMDAHTKICEHLKVIRQQADRTVDPKQKTDLYQLGLHLLNETDITYFAADQVSRIFTIRGQFLGGLDKREEAVKAFSYATQILMEKMPTTPPTAAFKAWGDQQDSVLQNDQTELAAMTAGAGALACFLEVARSVDSESRPKKYIGKLLWTGKQMVALGESATIRLNDIIEKNERTTVSYNWLPWVPQLINEVVHRPNSAYVKILARVCEDFPLQIFYNLRCIFAENITEAVVRDACLGAEPFDLENSEEWIQKLVPLMKQAISYRPADCRMFHELLSQMGNMREFWAERQHRYAVSVRNEISNCIHRQNPHILPQDMVLDQEAIEAIMTWKADFETYGGLFMSECEIRYLADEFYAVPTEEEFIRGMSMEIQGFFSMCPCVPGTIVRYLEQVTQICKKLYMRLVYLPKKIPLKLASPWLASFTNKMACIEMPKDLFNVQKTVGSSSKYTSSQYTSMLGRLDPYFSISLEGGEIVRKLCMRSINGKSCTYYLKKNVKDRTGAFECGQFMGHLNQLLAKERETSRRFLQTCIMNQVYVGYGCALIETSGGVIGENQLVGPKSPVLHPYDILRQRLVGIGFHPDDMVVLFYDRIFPFLIDQQAKQQQEVHLRQQVLIEYGEEHFIGRNNIIDLAMLTYPDATMYYNFRKQIAKHMAVHNIIDFLLQLAPTQLQDIYITRSFGQYTIPNCAFQHPEKMEARPVPFRLTHNFYNFLGFSADGDMRYCSEATISCMRYRSPEVYLRPLLWDFVAEVEPNSSYQERINTVNFMINGMRQRILTHDKPNDSDSADQTGVASLMKISLTTEAMAQNDPATYPWF